MAPVAGSVGKNIAVTGEASRIWVEGNTGTLLQAIHNLVENAIPHTAPGTTVEIAMGSEGSVVVRDEGERIPAERRDLIFQLFWRCDRRSTGSAGPGLSTVARVVHAHGAALLSLTRRYSAQRSR
jgi:signal transduction histidine kinase